MWGILTALLSGVLMSVQGVFNTEITKQAGLWLSAAWVQLSAFFVCMVVWLFTGRPSPALLWGVEHKYTLLGGVIGALITVTVIHCMGQLGPAQAVLLIVVSQLTAAWLVELLGLFGTERQPFSWVKALGMLLAVVGIVVFKWEK